MIIDRRSSGGSDAARAVAGVGVSVVGGIVGHRIHE
jgi:hypothetical protein